MTAIANHIQTSRRLKKSTAYLAAFACTGLVGWSGYQKFHNPEHPQGTRYSRTQIASRATEIGLALNGSIQVLCEPVLHQEQQFSGETRFANRKLWIVLCESGNRQMNLTFDDATGRLLCLIMDARPMNAKALDTKAQIAQKRRIGLRVTSEREAVQIAAARLRVLQTLPPTAQIALSDEPREDLKQNLWRISWLARNTPTSKPYAIKMAVERTSGLPTYMMNLEKKG